MKKYILIFALFFSIFLIDTYAQVATFRDSLKVSDATNIHHILQSRDWDYAFITITLSNATDTVKVYSGTNYPNIAYSNNDFVQTSLKDRLAWADVQVITGSTTKKGYMLLSAYKQRNFKLDAIRSTGTIYYTLETY
jgi:hypothetical protein